MSSPADGQGSPADALRARLAALGVVADVTVDGALAVVRTGAPAGGAPWLAGVPRADIVAAARDVGFTHVALELAPGGARVDHEAARAGVRRAEPAP